MKTPEEVLGDITPSKVLKGLMFRDNATSVKIANATGISKSIIDAILTNKIAIPIKCAKKLAIFFNVDANIFLGKYNEK